MTLYALTRDVDPDLALIGFACRVVEGVLGAMLIAFRLAGVEVGAAPRFNVMVGAVFFAVGSLLFSALFVRGRIVPRPLAWLGVVASAVLVVGLPLQLGRVIGATAATVMWLPMLAFEVPVAVWLLARVR